MIKFVDFLLTKVYNSKEVPEKFVNIAFERTVLDVQYHFPDLSAVDIKRRIQSNFNELGIFLFRLGRSLHIEGLEELKPQIHWLLKEMCSCEIYFNNDIAEGFYIVHGEGTVIGSRNKIGLGFKIHQGCTIEHKKNGEGKGNIIGNNVTMYCNSSVIGELKIGDNVIIGAHLMIARDLKDNMIVTSLVSYNEREIN
jgi:serine O-acetyltransferase